MGISANLQDVDHGHIAKICAMDALFELVWSLDRDAFPVLRGIDPFGDTMLNRIQLIAFEQELEHLVEFADERVAPIVRQLAEASQKVRRSRGYLYFWGD